MDSTVLPQGLRRPVSIDVDLVVVHMPSKGAGEFYLNRILLEEEVNQPTAACFKTLKSKSGGTLADSCVSVSDPTPNSLEL